MVKVHLDTDIGGDIDDLCALVMLLKWPGVEITGITTVTEANGRRAGYARYVRRLAGRSDIPVAAGADVSQIHYRQQPGFLSESDYWPERISPAPNPIDEALELLKASIDAGALIICTGPLTNLAFLDQRYPGLVRAARLFLMGGYIYPIPPGFPQWGNDMDYNLQMDIHAAKRILETYECTLIPLTMSVQTALRRAYLPGLRESGLLGALVARQAEAFARDEQNEARYGQTCAGLPDDIINFLHDPLACAVALGWEGARTEEVPLRLEIRDGWLHEKVDPEGKRQKVVVAIDAAGFNATWYRVVCRREGERQ